MEETHQWPQFLAVFFASFLAIGNGIQLSWPSPSVPRLLSMDMGFFITEKEVSYIVLLSPLGYVIGSPLCGFLLDRIGRKYTLLVLAPIQAITWIAIATSETTTTIYIARIMMGVSEGGMFTALPAYMGEILEPHVRGRVSATLSVGMLTGSLLINVYGSYVTIKTAACISLLLPIIFILTFMWMPESPYYLIAKGADKEARKSLKKLRRIINVEPELFLIKEAVQRQMSEPGRFQDIFFLKSNFKAFSILALLRTVQQLSGMYVIGFYMQVIFQISESSVSPSTSAIVCNGFRLCLIFGGSILLDRFGRKILISLSCAGTAFMLSIIATYFYFQSIGYDFGTFKWLPLVILMLYYVFCSIGLLIVPTLMMGELLPSNIKAKALTLLNIYFGLCMCASSKLFQWTKDSFGAHVSFSIFTLSCILGIIFTYLCVPETKGKTLEEIQEELRDTTTAKESKILLQQSSYV